MLNVSAFGFLNLCPPRPKLPELCGDATSRPLPLTRPLPVIVRTFEKQFSQLSLAMFSSKALPLRRPPGLGLGLPVLEDSKLGMLGTEGKGEVLVPARGLKFLANSALEGRRGWEGRMEGVLAQAGTSQGQSHLRLASSNARPKGHLENYFV